jgi:hypothetical protein
MCEEWREVEGSPGVLVSNYGRIQYGGVDLSLTDDGQGYLRVKGKFKGMHSINHKRIHRIVAETFVPNPKHKPIVDHIDHDKTNNVASNLQWVTYEENTKRAFEAGLLRRPTKPIAVEAYHVKTGHLYWFKSQGEAARELGISNASINKALWGHRKTTHGYQIRIIKDFSKAATAKHQIAI